MHKEHTKAKFDLQMNKIDRKLAQHRDKDTRRFERYDIKNNTY